MAHRFNLYIETQSLTRERVKGGTAIWSKRVLADTRTEALDKCLPEIRAKVLPLADPSIKYVSVFAGRVGSVTEAAFRLNPIQIVRETGKRRN